jgi:hypothetical protein
MSERIVASKWQYIRLLMFGEEKTTFSDAP